MDTNTIDSKGTTSEAAEDLLANLLTDGFSDDVKSLALALGRDEDEIESMLDGAENIDEDLLMKIRGVARERGLKIE